MSPVTPVGRPIKVLMTCMLRNHRLLAQRGLVDLREDGQVVWHATSNAVHWWHEDFLSPPDPLLACAL